jgi:hypothetical protein
MKIQSIVFRYAWNIRATEPKIKNPLREAWKRVKLAFRILDDAGSDICIFVEAYAKAKFASDLRRAFRVGKVAFQYYKKLKKGQTEKEVRPSVGTAPTASKYNRKTTKSKKPSSTGFYWDETANGIRSFKVANLIPEAGFQFVK